MSMDTLDGRMFLTGRAPQRTPTSSAPTLARAALVVLLGVIVAGAVLTASGVPSVLNYVKRTLSLAGTDSWMPMAAAHAHLSSGDGTGLYETVFFDRKIKFQYPPSSLIPHEIAADLGVQLTPAFLNGVGLFFMLAEIAAVAAMAAILVRRTGVLDRVRFGLPAAAGLAALATLAFYPTVKAVELGQVQAWLNAWFVLAALAWLIGREALAGALIGAICLFKPQFGLFLVWSLWRRRLGFAAGFLAVFCTGTLYAVYEFGLAEHIDYLRTIAFISRHGEVYYANQSMNGFLNRLIGNGDPTVWDGSAFAAYVPFVHRATMAMGLVLVAAAFLGYRRVARVSVLEFVACGLTFSLASPVAWEHHFGFLPAVIVVLAVFGATLPFGTRRTAHFVLLSLAYLGASHYLPQTVTATPGLASIFQSYLFFAALVMLLLLHAPLHRADLDRFARATRPSQPAALARFAVAAKSASHPNTTG